MAFIVSLPDDKCIMGHMILASTYLCNYQFYCPNTETP